MPVGQLHADDQPVADLPGAEGGKQVGVADVFNDLQGIEFQVARALAQADELQGDLEAAGRLGLPDLAEAAFAKTD